MDLIDWLVERQTEMGRGRWRPVPETEFASLLGMPLATWILHKSRDRGISKLLIDRALAAFPELRDDILRHAFPLTNDKSNTTTDGASASAVATGPR